MHKIDELYKAIYQLGKIISKRDRFGIFKHIEERCLCTSEEIIEASLMNKKEKLPILNKARINIEVLKRLVRMGNELGVMNDKIYINLEAKLQEISKMINGWRKYIEQQETQS